MAWTGLHFTASAVTTQRVEGIQHHMKQGLSVKFSLAQAFFEVNELISNQNKKDLYNQTRTKATLMLQTTLH
jgi:hypothetical protein